LSLVPVEIYRDTSKCVLGDNLAYTVQTLVKETFVLCIMRQSAKVSLSCSSITQFDSVTRNETAEVWTKKFDEQREDSARQRREHVLSGGYSH
jgi:hypothetical protein